MRKVIANYALEDEDTNIFSLFRDAYTFIAKKLRDVEHCSFEYLRLTKNWNTGDAAGTVYYTTHIDFQYLSSQVTSEVHSALVEASKSLKCTFNFAIRRLHGEFAIDIYVNTPAPPLKSSPSPKLSSSGSFEDNLKILKSKMAKMHGASNFRMSGQDLVFNMNGQTFRVLPDNFAAL